MAEARNATRCGVALALLTLGATGCAKPGPMPMCVAEVATPNTPEIEAKTLEPEVWMTVLLPDYDVTNGTVKAPTRDCTGKEVQWESPAREGASDPGPASPEPDSVPAPTETETGPAPGDVASAEPNPAPAPEPTAPPSPPAETEAEPVPPAGDDAPTAEDTTCLERDDPSNPLPREALKPRDVTISIQEDGAPLVWIATDKFDDGEAVGPLSRVEWTDRGIAVRAVGPMRTAATGASFVIDGSASTRYLVAEGRRCEPDDGGCRTVVRVAPILGGRVAERMITHVETGACLGPARFDRTRALDVEKDGWIRRFELTTSVKIDGETVRVQESVVVTELPAGSTDEEPRAFRDTEEARVLRMTEDGRLVTDRPSLWSRILDEDADVDKDWDLPPAEEAAAPTKADGEKDAPTSD